MNGAGISAGRGQEEPYFFWGRDGAFVEGEGWGRERRRRSSRGKEEEEEGREKRGGVVRESRVDEGTAGVVAVARRLPEITTATSDRLLVPQHWTRSHSAVFPRVFTFCVTLEDAKGSTQISEVD